MYTVPRIHGPYNFYRGMGQASLPFRAVIPEGNLSVRKILCYLEETDFLIYGKIYVPDRRPSLAMASQNSRTAKRNVKISLSPLPHPRGEINSFDVKKKKKKILKQNYIFFLFFYIIRCIKRFIICTLLLIPSILHKIRALLYLLMENT